MPGVAGADFKGAVTLVNVWASWCVPCHDEAPLLMKLAEDSASASSASTTRTSPRTRAASSAATAIRLPRSAPTSNGRASIDWGVYGVPETFMVGRDGRIAYKLVGPITADNLQATLKPQIEKALAQSK